MIVNAPGDSAGEGVTIVFRRREAHLGAWLGLMPSRRSPPRSRRTIPKPVRSAQMPSAR